MTCEQLKEEYELHALGIASTIEGAEIENHLRSGCVNCTDGVMQALVTNSRIMQIAPDVEVPKRLRKRVLASVGVETPQWGWRLAWAAGFAALIVGMVGLGVQGKRNAAEVAGAREALSILNEPETRQVVFGENAPNPPKGRVFVNSKQGVLLIASNLPPAPAGKTYEMWVIPKGGAPKPSGLFQSDAGGAAIFLSKTPLDLSSTAAVAVTLEPESGSVAPTSTPLIVAALQG